VRINYRAEKLRRAFSAARDEKSCPDPETPLLLKGEGGKAVPEAEKTGR
jgi:hypothetical protein